MTSQPIPYKGDPDVYEFRSDGWAVPWELKSFLALVRMEIFEQLPKYIREQIDEGGRNISYRTEQDLRLLRNFVDLNNDGSDLLKQVTSKWMDRNRDKLPYRWDDGLERQAGPRGGSYISTIGKNRRRNLMAAKERAKQYFN